MELGCAGDKKHCALGLPLPFLLSKLSNLLNANEILSEWHLIL